MSGPGHLFVVHGDLTSIHADDLLIPCDTGLNVTPGWAPLVGPTVPGRKTYLRVADATVPPAFDAPDRPPLLLPEPSRGRRVWLLNSGGRPGDLDWLLAGIRSAIATVTAAAAEPRWSRERRLVALPIFGVGEGGFADQRGAVLDAMLRTLTEAVGADGAPDLVLVLRSRADYAAVQARRRGQGQASGEMSAEITRLGELARRAGLVLFLGAGASAGAGLLSWKQLLASLAEASTLDEAERAAAIDLPAPDAADVIDSALTTSLHEVITSQFRQDGYALTHGLLASLQASEAVTTNYDTLYENAATITHGGHLRVLPRERREGDEPWLLKLHGDIDLDGSIVLTRGQYLRFDADSVPLASVVQSLMVTKHMLFVGYSLSDDNFIRLARQVRALFTETHNSGPVGTVLSLRSNPARERLWRGDLEFLSFAETPTDTTATTARRLEIFLDQLGVAACDDTPYVLDPLYRSMLSDTDHALAEALRPVVEAGRSAEDSPAWEQARRLIVALGGSAEPR